MTAAEPITRIKSCSLYNEMHVVEGVLHRVPTAKAQHLPPVLRHEDESISKSNYFFKQFLYNRISSS